MDSLQDAVRPERGGCGPALGKLVPVGFRAEAWRLFVLSGPLFLFQVLSFMIYVVSSVFCGHLGRVELASVTLSVAFINVCGVSVGLGFSSACDTLMSQVGGPPGAGQGRAVPPCCPKRGGDPQRLLGAPWSGSLSSRPGGAAASPAPPPAPSQFAQTVFLLLYIVLRKLHRETWAGGPPAPARCLQDWGPFFSLALPSMLMICMEWWAYEIGSFLMGLLSMVDLSAQAVIYEVATVTYMIPMGLSISVCVRVGTSLGAADTVQAQRSAVSGVLCTVGTSLVIGALLSLLKNNLGYLFTNDEEVIALVNKVMPIYIVFQLFEAICCVYGGVLRGTGRQAFGAVVNAIAYYAIGLPLGIVLAFVVRMRTMGLWLGMLVCGVLAAAALAAYTARMDWALAAEAAEKYTGLRQQGTEHPASGAPRAGPEEGAGSAGNAGGASVGSDTRPAAACRAAGTRQAQGSPWDRVSEPRKAHSHTCPPPREAMSHSASSDRTRAGS
ncbi:PREDICTED: multidrug and toxin extrusion protein 2 [Myotis davidii]|uniref:multidrug and toxin extrusion protein 2 n=1 Tax=Myotis davidii TaxID=225400 RepID=UPI0003EBB70E|nr:PREDICTED: multidrug and toxin extrusion protein 2 [Myotis davidii]